MCSACWSSIREVTKDDDLYRDTYHKLVQQGHISGLISKYYFDKDATLQSLIHELKYNGMTSIGVLLGERVGEVLQDQVDVASIAGLVPVPLHRAKLRERGYNQSEYICKGISKTSGIRVYPKLLRRIRYTESQTQLGIDERKGNVAEAFAVNPPPGVDITRQTFVIVDDVITTGATIESCGSTLIQAGAKQVLACSVALAP